MSSPILKTGGRYPVLRAMGVLSLFGTLIVLAIGIYWTWWAIARSLSSVSEKIGMVAVILSATYFAVVMVLGIAELIKLLIDIEHNTRVAAKAQDSRLVDGEEESAEAALIRGH